MLLRNAIVAGSGDAPVDLHLEHGVIAEIGTALTTTGHDVIDLDGRFLVPGLWDNHVHFSQWALGQQRVDISAGESAAQTAALIIPTVRGWAGPETVVGYGFRDGLWPDAPNLRDLDAASPTIPVVLVSGDLHAVWLNSAALARYGHAGHATGLLREGEAFDVTGRLGVVADSTLDEWAAQAASSAAARGITGIVDYEMAWNHEAWQRRQAAGAESLRVEFGIYAQHLDRAIAEGLHSGRRLGDLLTVGNLKVIIDGSLNTRTAYCYDEYPGLKGHAHPHGLLTVTPDELRPLLTRAVEAGIVPSVHAIGDHAVSLVLDAFEEIGSGGRMEHAQLVSLPDLARFAQLGVAASVQPEHAMDDRDVADRYWAGRTSRAFVLRSLLDAGAELLLGSDAPVAPLDPWVTIAAAVGRARDGRKPWHPEQAITATEAIAASARTTVAVGQPADLVAVEIDPRKATAEQLRAMPVSATLLGGRFTHNAL